MSAPAFNLPTVQDIDNACVAVYDGDWEKGVQDFMNNFPNVPSVIASWLAMNTGRDHNTAFRLWVERNGGETYPVDATGNFINSEPPSSWSPLYALRDDAAGVLAYASSLI